MLAAAGNRNSKGGALCRVNLKVNPASLMSGSLMHARQFGSMAMPGRERTSLRRPSWYRQRPSFRLPCLGYGLGGWLEESLRFWLGQPERERQRSVCRSARQSPAAASGLMARELRPDMSLSGRARMIGATPCCHGSWQPAEILVGFILWAG
jgi:hypothetical protein